MHLTLTDTDTLAVALDTMKGVLSQHLPNNFLPPPLPPQWPLTP